MLGRKQKALQKSRSADFNPDFVFTEKEGMYDGSWALADVMSQLKKKVRLTEMRFGWWTVSGYEDRPLSHSLLPLFYLQQLLEPFENGLCRFDGVGRGGFKYPTVLTNCQ